MMRRGARSSLRNVLRAWCALDVMAYTQGMNIIAAAALVAAEHDEDQAFRLFAWLMRSHRTLFGGAGLVGARVECRALRLLLEARNPELWRGERTLSDAIEMCASQWMLSLWVGVLPLDGVWAVWRLLLAEGDEALPATNLRVAVALLEAAAPTVARALADDAAAAAECAEVEAGAGGENTYAAVSSAAAGVADIGALVAPVALDAEALRDARVRARAEIDAEEAAKVARRRQPRIESPITTAGVARRSSGQAVGRGLLLVALSGILFSAMAALTRAAAAHGATAAVVVLVSAIVRWSCLVVLLCARREPLLPPPRRRRLILLRCALGWVAFSCAAYSFGAMEVGDAAIFFTSRRGRRSSAAPSSANGSAFSTAPRSHSPWSASPWSRAPPLYSAAVPASRAASRRRLRSAGPPSTPACSS